MTMPMRMIGDAPAIPRGQLRPLHGRRDRAAAGRAQLEPSRRLANMVLADFEAHQGDVLPRLRQWFLPQYASLIGRLMTRGGEEPAEVAAADELAGGDLAGADAAALERLIAAARVALARIEAGEGALADLDAALGGEGEAPAEVGGGDAWLG